MCSAVNDRKREKHVISLYENVGLTAEVIIEFQHLIKDYYRYHGREFPWRQTSDPYHILVSEIMLQQTQTSRVMRKYDEFIATFPDLATLAKASLVEVLSVWQGMGYNRRAVALHKLAQMVLNEFNGVLPVSSERLRHLPGIGNYTASAVMAIAYNQPEVCIETNIRTVFTYFFFQHVDKLSDQEIIPFVEATIDRENPREWYYALFDYGSMLKTHVKLNNKNVYYHKQSTFSGSNREIRGKILRVLITHSQIKTHNLIEEVGAEYEQVMNNVEQLQREGFITVNDYSVSIA